MRNLVLGFVFGVLVVTVVELEERITTLEDSPDTERLNFAIASIERLQDQHHFHEMASDSATTNEVLISHA